MADFGATDELLLLGIGAARDHDAQQARFYLEWVLRDEPTDAQAATAWYWLAHLASDPAERRRYLEQALCLAPLHPEARRDLAVLDGRLKPEEIIDHRQPLAPLTPGGPVLPREVQRPRCPSCGGALVFSAGQASARCQFCGYQGERVTREQVVEEQDWVAAIYTARGHRWVLPTEHVLTCQGCGAMQTLPPGQVSTSCSYCGSPQVIQALAAQDLLAPEGIATFSVNATDALDRARGWLAARPFSPSDLAERAVVATPRPIYFPCWTFDIEGEIHWSGYARRSWHNGASPRSPFGVLGLTWEQQRVPERGVDPVSLDDVLVPATPAIPADLLAELRYDTGTLTPYSPEFLLGWPAELYRVPVADASLVARAKAIALHQEYMTRVTHQEIEGFTIQQILLSVASYKLILLPAWITNYRYREQAYPLLINGQTGTAAGEGPRSRVGTLLAALVEPNR